MNANRCPACHCLAMRIALGIDIWNLAESVVTSDIFLPIIDRMRVGRNIGEFECCAHKIFGDALGTALDRCPRRLALALLLFQPTLNASRHLHHDGLRHPRNRLVEHF